MVDFEAAIFDLDGTLIDSMGVWEKIDVDFLEKRNLIVPAEYKKEISALTFKETADYTIKLFGLKDSADDLMREWNDMALHEYSHNVKLKPYAKEYLALLKDHGVKLGTATSLSYPLSEPVLRNNGIYDFFDIQCTSDEAGRGKNFPDVFILAAKKLGVPPEKCIVFEDLLPGVLSAKKAGMMVYCIYDNYSKALKGEIEKIADSYIYDFKNAPVPISRNYAVATESAAKRRYHFS